MNPYSHAGPSRVTTDGDYRGAFKNRGHHRVTCAQSRLNAASHQALDCCGAGADVDEINVQTMPLKGADLFRHPDPGHAGADGRIGDADFFFRRFGAIYWQGKENSEREETINNTASFSAPNFNPDHIVTFARTMNYT